MAGAEMKESFWKQHLADLSVGGFAVLLLVVVAGQLLDEGEPTDAGAQPSTPSSSAVS